MARYKGTPEFTVKSDVFDTAAANCSARLLYYERIGVPIRWEGDWWVCTSMMVSHSKSWATMHQVVPIEEWDEVVQVYGCFDEDWIEEREKSGLFWRGVKVQIEGDAREFVLGVRVRWVRQPNPRSSPIGQNA